jgi:hypothetical protein
MSKPPYGSLAHERVDALNRRVRNDMLMNFTKMLRNSRSVGLAVALIAVATHAQAQAVRGPFATFPGSWSGSGAISLASGGVERLHCTAEYRVDDGGATLMQNLSCASDSLKVDLKNQIQANGSDIAGQWVEVTRHAEGAIVGRVSAGRIEGTVTGPGFTATFSLQTRANQQQILIRTQGGDIAQISAALTRAR